MRTIAPFTKPLTAAIAAALLMSGAAAAVSAAPLQTNPIHIDNVRVDRQSISNDDPSVAIAAQISFTNEYTAPANRVEFVLKSRGNIIDSFEDVGDFAPGVTISHTFPESQSRGDVTVDVASATFADGSTWQNPGVVGVADAPEHLFGDAESYEY